MVKAPFSTLERPRCYNLFIPPNAAWSSASEAGSLEIQLIGTRCKQNSPRVPRVWLDMEDSQLQTTLSYTMSISNELFILKGSDGRLSWNVKAGRYFDKHKNLRYDFWRVPIHSGSIWDGLFDLTSIALEAREPANFRRAANRFPFSCNGHGSIIRRTCHRLWRRHRHRHNVKSCRHETEKVHYNLDYP